jgi:predicted permease
LFVITYDITESNGQQRPVSWFDYPQFRYLRATLSQEADLIAISEPRRNAVIYGASEEGEKSWNQMVSGWMFSSFGLRPALGRLLLPSDDTKPGGSPVAVLSYSYWSSRFNRDPKVIGRNFRIGRDLYQIVGVCEPGFTGTDPGTMTDMFLPTMMNSKAINNRHWGWFRTWLRLQPGVSREAVTNKLRSAERRWRVEEVQTWDTKPSQRELTEFLNAAVQLEPASAGFSGLQSDYRKALLALGGLVGLLLLIACGNMANLMMARAAARSREMALRVSIGAGRRRLMQLMLVESFALAAIASVLGLAFAWRAAPFVVEHINPPSNPARLALPADWRVASFAIVLALAVTALFGIAPALRASATTPMKTLRGEEVRSRRRVMRALIGGQVALCFLVQFLAGLFIATFDHLSRQPLGFSADRVLAIEANTANNQVSTNWEGLVRQLRATPGIQTAAVCSWALMTGNGWSDTVWVSGKRDEFTQPYFLGVSPGWLDTMRIPLLAGRDFVPGEKGKPVAIVNSRFAAHYFHGENAVGRQFQTMDHGKPIIYTVVGLSRDARYLDMREPLRPTAYVPFSDSPDSPGWGTFVIRTSATDPATMLGTVRRVMAKGTPQFRVVNAVTQRELVEQHTIRERLLAKMAVFFGTFALILSGVGLYGVLTYSVVQRRRDISIRVALGANSREVVTRVLKEVALVVAAGTLSGVGAALFSQRYVASLLYEVRGTDPSVLGAPALMLLAVVAGSAMPPIFRALHLNPVEILRMD